MQDFPQFFAPSLKGEIEENQTPFREGEKLIFRRIYAKENFVMHLSTKI